MFNFREEIESLKKVKTDYHLFEAEKFLKTVFDTLKTFDVSDLQRIRNLSFTYTCINNEETIKAAINNGEIIHSETYSTKIAVIGIFKKIKSIINESKFYAVVSYENSIHIDF